jgi:hypothetical protein
LFRAFVNALRYLNLEILQRVVVLPAIVTTPIYNNVGIADDLQPLTAFGQGSLSQTHARPKHRIDTEPLLRYEGA